MNVCEGCVRVCVLARNSLEVFHEWHSVESS